MHACMYICIYIYIYVCMHACMYAMYVCMYVCMDIYIYIYIKIYIYIYMVPPLKPTFLTYSSDGWVKRGFPYIHAKGIIYVYIYIFHQCKKYAIEVCYWDWLHITSMIAFWEERIQNAFSAKNKNQDFPGLLNKSWNFRTKTKNQDSCRTPEQILNFPNQNQEPRLLQDSWTNLGISEPKPRTKIAAGLLNKSWNFRTTTKNQDCCRTPEQILEFPNQNQEPRFLQDSWTNLGISEPKPRTLLQDSWTNLGISEPKPRIKNQDCCRTPEQILEFPKQNQEPRFPEDSGANLGSWF